MRLSITLAALAISGLAISSASATVYTSSAAFLPNVAAGSFFNNFSSVAAGPSSALNFAGGGFSYTVDSSPTANNLYNDPGVISTNLATEQIKITFTGAPVTAIGGNFWGTDINVLPVANSPVILTLSDGTIETYNSNAATDYRGFTTLLPITTMLIDATGTTANVNIWPTLDNLTVGRVAPEPASLSLMAVGATLLRRRRA